MGYARQLREYPIFKMVQICNPSPAGKNYAPVHSPWSTFNKGTSRQSRTALIVAVNHPCSGPSDVQ